MARILIEPAKARGVLGLEDSLESLLCSFSQDVDSVRRGLRYKIAGEEQISARLKEVAAQLTKEAAATRAMHNGLDQVIQRYEQTENGNRDRASSAEHTSIQQNAEAPAAAVNPYEFKWGDLALKELANLVGPFGLLINGGKKLSDGNAVGAFGELIKSLGKTAKTIIDKPKAEWAKNLFGGNMVTEAPSLLSKIGDFSSWGKAANTICSWAAALLGSGVSNYREFGEGSFENGRFWAETLNEGAIKIFEGAAIGAGVAAAAVAIFGGAPAIAIGAASIGVTALADWGLNSAVRFFTGDPTAEWVECLSDAVLDFGEAVVEKGKAAIETGKKIVKEAGNVIMKTADAVSDKVKKFGEGVSNFFSGCRWGREALSGAW